ncbi:MAG: prepilin-type N-terminal cleavage/methylation domain-containing protein [Candidatus Berkelbacteria bacterium]|nr:prepilin-type N-terminal cleavage/methylation domain-containing protein [Candidatus Berkelbacteria bacterium]
MQRFGNKSQGGYTLIEMLISVTIFSGLLIIVLGVVATSSSSSAKVSVLREKSQAARGLIDQISNDLRYVDTEAEFTDSNTRYKGYVVESTRLVIALSLPNADPEWPFVRKEYTIETVSNRLTIRLLEERKCKITNFEWDCNPAFRSPVTDLLDSAYTLNQEAGFPSEFGGINVVDAEQLNPKISPFVSITFTVKPSDYTASCSAEPGTCYKVSTSINSGGSR